MKSKTILYILITIVTIVIPIFIFSIQFHDQIFSSNTSRWSEFATYLSSFISLANLMIFIFLSKEIHDYNLKRDEQLSKLEKPILSFYRNTVSSTDYFVENIGKGAAINVIINCSLNESEKSWNESFIYYSFSQNQKQIVSNKTPTNALMAIYSDIYGTIYTSFMENDKLVYFEVAVEKKEKKYKDEYEKSIYTSPNPTWKA